MPTALLLSLCLASPAAAGAPPGEPAWPSLAAEVAALAAQPPPLQTQEKAPAPRGWISLGAGFNSLEIDSPGLGDPDEDNLVGGEFGFYKWSGDMGVGIEAGLMFSSYDVDINTDPVFGTPQKDTVDVRRWMLGLRLADRGTSPRFLPFARAGFLFREDDGGLVSNDGTGFYAGVGLDFLLVKGFALTPQLLYLDSSSFGAEEWIGTLQLTLQL